MCPQSFLINFFERHIMKFQTLIAALALTIGASAFAQAPTDPTATPRIDQREVNQQKRIDQGVASGQLTPKEAAGLENREAKIANDEAAAKADGKVTTAERVKLKREQNRASRAIYRQKHDGQKVAPAAPTDPTATPRIDQREVNQQKRIDQGVASGQLTPKEAARLENREAKIANDEAAAKADGKVTGAERRKLQREENRASAAIKRQKHDGQKVAPVAAK